MKERFENPPLVELVAELRWKDLSVPEGLPPGFPAGFAFPGSQAAFDQQHPEMTSAMTSFGYGQSERLVPAGFPVPPEAPIIRYRYSGPSDEGREHLPSTLFQIGSGIFTANAVKPYKSWEEFSPIVQRGVEILLETQKSNVGGYSLILRYIDAFRSDLTGDMTHSQFLRDVLGFKIGLPETLNDHAEGREVEVSVAQIVVPLKFGVLQLQVAKGEVEGTPAFILENVVLIDGLIAADVGAIMENFSNARNVIHDVFIKLSAPIKDKMVPVREQG